GSKEGTTTASGKGSGTTSRPVGPGDTAFEVPNIEVKGFVFEPEALGRPGMPLAEPKGQKVPLTGAKLDAQIKKQREAIAKAKDQVQKEANAALLATSLYHKSKEIPEDQQKKLFEDARQSLRDVAQAAGDKVDEVTLRMLGSYEMMLDDFPA